MLRRCIGFVLLFLGMLIVIGMSVLFEQEYRENMEPCESIGCPLILPEESYPHSLKELVPPYPHLRQIHSNTVSNKTTLMAFSKDSITDILTFYKEQLPLKGWAPTETEPIELGEEGGEWLFYEKGTLKIDIHILPIENAGAQSLMFTLTGADQIIQPDNPKAREILTKMQQRYLNCKSYRDTGKVESYFHSDDQGKRVFDRILHLKTAFVHPDRLRFEMREDGAQSLFEGWTIHSDASGARGWDLFLDDDVEESEYVRVLFSSCGNESLIPQLLVDDDLHFLAFLTELETPKEESMGNIPCYRVSGMGDSGRKHHLWISKENLLLLRHETEYEMGNLVCSEVTTWSGEMDVPISDKELAFRPVGMIPIFVARVVLYFKRVVRDYRAVARLIMLSGCVLFLAGLALSRRGNDRKASLGKYSADCES